MSKSVLSISQGGTGASTAAASLTSLGVNPAPVVIAINTNAVANNIYVLTASLILTLPPAPNPGDPVTVVNLSGTITASIARNGKNIMSIAQDLTLDVLTSSTKLVFVNDAIGWIIV